MNSVFITLYIILGILIRIAIPIALTFLLSWHLHRLDVRWREEARQIQAEQPILAAARIQQACWDYNQCSEESKAKCPAYNQIEFPCWEVFRSNGSLRKMCQECDYRLLILTPARRYKEK